LKCSVCAQDIPEDRYSDHLETEHGVTDDPTAVLIQHLTGLHSTPAEGDGDEGLPDEEPSDADAFEEFLAAHPGDEEAGADGGAKVEAADDQEEEPEEEAEPEEAPVADAEHDDEEADEEAPDEDERAEADEQPASADDEGGELTDEDEAEFERMLATYPEVDLRKGSPEAATAGAGAETEEVAAAAAGGAGAVATAAATGDRDDKTFAVWDEARTPPAEDEVLPPVVAPAVIEKARRRRQAALLGIGACIILVAIAVIYLLTRDTGSKTNTSATSPTLGTTATSVSPTFLPGPANGEPTTVGTQPPVTSAPPATTATPATTAPATTIAPTTDPGSRIVFSYSGATCTASGSLSVFGTITNTNSATYTFSYQIVLLRSDGTQQGTANGQVTHLPPGGRFGPGTIGTGTCTYPLASGPSPRQQITSISPG